MGVGGREADGQRKAVAIDDHEVLRAGLTAIRGVGPGLLAPLLARTLMLSRLDRLQSMAASSPSQSSSVSCSCCQTPATCQSRSRRQQVVPLPQPSSFGSSRHGQPVLSTNTMPARAARSGRRGRPPFGFGGSCGSRGSIASQRASGTRDEVFMTSDHATARGVLKHGLSGCHSELAGELAESRMNRHVSAIGRVATAFWVVVVSSNVDERSMIGPPGKSTCWHQSVPCRLRWPAP